MQLPKQATALHQSLSVHYPCDAERAPAALQAIAAMVQPASQEPSVQLRMNHEAATHWASGLQVAAHLSRPDLGLSAAQGLWGCCLPFLAHPTLRCIALAPLAEATTSLLALKLPDQELQVR